MRWLLLIILCSCAGTVTTPLGPIRPATKFNPSAQVEQETRKALARWIAATGLPLGITDYGVPILVQSDWIYDKNGDTSCGKSYFINNMIIVSTKKQNCSYYSFESLVLHEIGHMLTKVPYHSETGIMAKGGLAENRECIDEASLNLICSNAPCTVFNPEC